ncbi:ubiquitin-like domain-containing protein [Candidatus Saccharibacteria bacterium]|nr:ubiquitin-like domain-containing protein [Candidatus Saccharibacteria bacterium]
MKIQREETNLPLFILGLVIVGLIFTITMKALPSFADTKNSSSAIATGQHFVSVYDNGTDQTVTLKTDASTVTDVLERANISIDTGDIVEPGMDELLTSENFRINIYRAKPAIIIDGIKQYKIMTAASAPTEVVKAAGITLLEADVVKITTLDNFLEAGLPFAYTVIRAKTINFDFYGQELVVRTGTNTIEEFLNERNISVTSADWLSLPLDTKIEDGMQLKLARQGKTTVTVDEEISFSEQLIYDYAYNMGYRAISKVGVVGKKAVTYEIEMKDGQEISRKRISEIVTQEPVTQQITVGARTIAMNPLTKQMGRNRYTTSTGILREETWYDLDMSGVMKIKQRECGGSATYTVRADGVKVDEDGYVIVAAHLDYYPRCSLVETSLGLGKVYDTGSFANSNPEQFDIATDWSNWDGR